jgi:hypothetical protein
VWHGRGSDRRPSVELIRRDVKGTRSPIDYASCMTTTELRPRLADVHDMVPRPEAGPPRLGLTAHDAQEVTAYVRGDPGQLSELVEDARALADGLASFDGDNVRVRLLARIVAAARTQQRVLDQLLAQTLAQRDEVGHRLVAQSLNGVQRRLEGALKQLAVESALRQRPSINIRHADTVSISDGRS